MAKVTLRATGGLNKDVDPNNLPEGDYVDASNIVFDSGKTGGAGALRLMESFASMGITLNGTPRATFQNIDNIIYVLCNNIDGTATIYKIIPSGDSFNSSAILTYPHNATDVSMTPDLKVIGNTLVWNYAESGTVLAYNLTLDINLTFSSIEDLKLQKKTPNNVVKIKKVIGTSPIALLENTDFQFAARYQYASKEYSVLGNYSQMFKAEKGVEKYVIQYDFTSKPFYATDIELYVRIGNNGNWRKADVQKIADYTALAEIDWTGQMNESLDLVTVGKPFDAIPENAKSIEIAKNRVFLANIQDDYSLEAANTKLTISVADETAFGGTGYKTYFGAGASDINVTSSETSYGGSEFIKPFANNSTYAFGIAYYDAALKTRGVEAKTIQKFTTGKFSYRAIPNITVTPATGYAKPSWAKYLQLVYSKNISKSYSYEGFASNIFFELSVLEENAATKVVSRVTKISQSVTKDQLPDVKYFVVDLMGMFLGGRIYTLQEGDRISINIGTTSAREIIDLRIVEQNGNLIYCDYSGGVLTNPEIPVPKDLFFEIYSPRQAQEDEALLFYEYGSLVDISAGLSTIVFKGTGTLNSDKLIGDMVFSKIEIPVYDTSPFENTTEKLLPITYEENKKIVAVCSMSGISISDTAVSTEPHVLKTYPKWTSFGTGNDSGYASIVGSGAHLKVARFYEFAQQEAFENKVTINFSLDITAVGLTFSTTETDPSYVMTGGLKSSLIVRLYRLEYDNKTNKYSSSAVKFGNDIGSTGSITYADYSASVLTKTVNFEGNFALNTLPEINANDKFYIEVESTHYVEGDAQSGCEISVTGHGSTPIVMTLNGDPNLVKVTTKYNPAVTLGSTNEKYIIRSISNAVSNQQWNTSAGKPSVIATNLSYPRRTNAIRYSGNYIAGTSVNNINSFFALDSNEVPIENGEIVSLQRASRLQGNGAMLLALCPQETAYVFLGEQELTQGNNSAIRALTTNMIGTIRNMGAGLGVQNKLSVMNQKGTIWWWDNFTKKVVKYTDKGVEIPSDVYVKSYFLPKSGIARFSYDPFYNMSFIGFIGESTSLGWSDNLNRWIAEYSFVPTFAESYGDKMILLSGSTFYKSLQTGYNTFFGSANNGTISMILNSRLPVNPLNVAIWHDMNVTDYTKAADTNGEKNYVKDNLLQINITNENGQATQILEGNFLLEDNRLYAHIMRDTNTPNVTYPLIQGDYMVGFLNKFTITMKDKSQNMRINSIDVEIGGVSGHS